MCKGQCPLFIDGYGDDNGGKVVFAAVRGFFFTQTGCGGGGQAVGEPQVRYFQQLCLLAPVQAGVRIAIAPVQFQRPGGHLELEPVSEGNTVPGFSDDDGAKPAVVGPVPPEAAHPVAQVFDDRMLHSQFQNICHIQNLLGGEHCNTACLRF